MSLWLHLTRPVCTAQAGQVHASVPRLIRRKSRRTWDTLCGLRRASLVVQDVVNEFDGPVVGRGTVPWPMKVAEAKEMGLTRCRDCYTLNPKGTLPAPPRTHAALRDGDDE